MRVRYKGVNLWESFILLLSIYVIVELGYEVIYPLSDAAIWWVNTIDLVICAIFIGDFFYFSIIPTIGRPISDDIGSIYWRPFRSCPFSGFSGRCVPFALFECCAV